MTPWPPRWNYSFLSMASSRRLNSSSRFFISSVPSAAGALLVFPCIQRGKPIKLKKLPRPFPRLPAPLPGAEAAPGPLPAHHPAPLPVRAPIPVGPVRSPRGILHLLISLAAFVFIEEPDSMPAGPLPTTAPSSVAALLAPTPRHGEDALSEPSFKTALKHLPDIPRNEGAHFDTGCRGRKASGPRYGTANQQICSCCGQKRNLIQYRPCGQSQVVLGMGDAILHFNQKGLSRHIKNGSNPGIPYGENRSHRALHSLWYIATGRPERQCGITKGIWLDSLCFLIDDRAHGRPRVAVLQPFGETDGSSRAPA